MKQVLIILLIMSFFAWSCKKENATESYSISGKVQKGPFITGTTITIFDLNDDLSQTGKTFTTNITDNSGNFDLANIELTSGIVLLTVTGYYFNEILGELSGSALTLQCITDLNNSETVNINVLTNIIAGRIQNLVSDGIPFLEAKTQAESEIREFLGINDINEINPETLDISQNSQNNAILLAFSVILQRNTIIYNQKPGLTAELSELLANLVSDFKVDGQINNQDLLNQLNDNISTLNLIDIRNNIETRYSELEQNVDIPEFENYIAKYQEKHSDTLYADFYFPEQATPHPESDPGVLVPNILTQPEGMVSNQMTFCLAAYVPLYCDLKIKIIPTSGEAGIGGPLSGWKYESNSPNGFIFYSQRRNELMTLMFQVNGLGQANIEFYYNGSEEPDLIKSFSWDVR